MLRYIYIKLTLALHTRSSIAFYWCYVISPVWFGTSISFPSSWCTLITAPRAYYELLRQRVNILRHIQPSSPLPSGRYSRLLTTFSMIIWRWFSFPDARAFNSAGDQRSPAFMISHTARRQPGRQHLLFAVFAIIARHFLDRYLYSQNGAGLIGLYHFFLRCRLISFSFNFLRCYCCRSLQPRRYRLLLSLYFCRALSRRYIFITVTIYGFMLS